MTFDFVDLNAKVAIAFSLVLIVALLTYIAFYKDSVEKKIDDIQNAALVERIRGEVMALCKRFPVYAK